MILRIQEAWRHLADAHTRASQTSFVPELTDNLQYGTEKWGGALHEVGRERRRDPTTALMSLRNPKAPWTWSVHSPDIEGQGDARSRRRPQWRHLLVCERSVLPALANEAGSWVGAGGRGS